MEAGDAERVAALYLKILRRKDAAPSPALVRYVRSFYCDGPFREPDIPSLVYTDDGGRVTGFVGVNTVPMLYEGRRLRAAYCGSLMVDNHASAPLAGAGLLKAYLAGPQDISISETASPVAQAMWERLRGQVLTSHSLDWVRVLRPAGFALATAARRLPWLRIAAPLASLADAVVQRRARKSGLALLLPEPLPGGLTVEAIGAEEFSSLVKRFSESYALKPDWSGGYGKHVLAESLEKPEYGEPAMAVVQARGTAVGAFLYHQKPGGIRRVLQVLAAPGRMGLVMQCLYADALEKGAVGVRGRSEPSILQAVQGRSTAFATVASTVVYTRDAGLLASIQAGNVFVNGLAGESWCRLFGGMWV